MPYNWTKSDPAEPAQELHLWPHQSLPPRGHAGFVLGAFVALLIPLLGLLGSKTLWGILPFILMAVAGLWLGLERSYRNAQINEVLTLTKDRACLRRTNPSGEIEEWDCNRYWAQARMHQTGGPVPHYVTLKGAGREVEIGAFLSEHERKALYPELLTALQHRTDAQEF